MAKQLIYFFLFGAAFGATDYSYDRCASNGPANWGGQCQGQKNNSEGTPIDLCGAKTFPLGAPVMNLSQSYYTSRSMTILNNGHTIEIRITDTTNKPTLELGNISAIVGRSTNQTNQTWILQQIHFHWGRTDLTNEGSEHYMQGVRYPIEAHYVHYNGGYADFSTAVGSGNSDALLVVGVFLAINGQPDVALMTTVAANVATATQTPKAMSQNVVLTDLIDPTTPYYSYRGSLTTPGCNQIVTWVVMSTVKPITLTTLNKFKAATANPAALSGKFAPLATSGLISDYGNFRPLQPLGNRTIWYSAGTTSACTNPSEPTFTCTSGASMAAPSMVAQLAILCACLLVSKM